jgi:hypothetical protein
MEPKPEEIEAVKAAIAAIDAVTIFTAEIKKLEEAEEKLAEVYIKSYHTRKAEEYKDFETAQTNLASIKDTVKRQNTEVDNKITEAKEKIQSELAAAKIALVEAHPALAALAAAKATNKIVIGIINQGINTKIDQIDTIKLVGQPIASQTSKKPSFDEILNGKLNFSDTLKQAKKEINKSLIKPILNKQHQSIGK